MFRYNRFICRSEAKGKIVTNCTRENLGAFYHAAEAVGVKTAVALAFVSRNCPGIIVDLRIRFIGQTPRALNALRYIAQLISSASAAKNAGQ